MNALSYFAMGPQVRTVLADFTPADTVSPAVGMSGFLRRTPPVTTSTMPRERRLFVWFRHKMAAENMLADMLGDVPRLTPIHEADQLRGLPVRAPGTWIEVTNHEYVVPEQLKHQVKVSGLVVMELHDKWCREKRIAEIKDASRECRTFRTDIAPDDLL